jgi:hypothetical protein
MASHINNPATLDSAEKAGVPVVRVTPDDYPETVQPRA